MATRAWFAIPGDLNQPTGGYRYDLNVLKEIAAGATPGFHLDHLQLPDGFPNPGTEDLTATRTALEILPKGAPVLVDGLALGACPVSLFDGLTLDLVALVHHPLAMETGIDRATARHLRRTEKAVLGLCRAVIVTSPVTARTLVDDYDVPGDLITVALPGISASTKKTRPKGVRSEPLKVLSVGSYTPRKGHDLLVETLVRVRDLDWTCHIVGAEPDGPAHREQLAQVAKAGGVDERIVFEGALDECALDTLYGEADIFILLTRYEGYGMVFAEAMTHGLPVIAGRGGAVSDTVPTSAGALVPVNDVDAAEAALRRLLTSKGARQAASASALEAAKALPDWAETARRIAAVVGRFQDG